MLEQREGSQLLKITNRNNYPLALVKAVEADPYDKGDCDFSATELIKPSRLRALSLVHKDEIVVDVEDRIWSLLGQSVHTVLERANETDLAEKRYFTIVGKWKISAQIDTLSLIQRILTDYKCTTSYKFVQGKPIPIEFIQQLNIQAFILRKNGIVVDKLRIVGILRDHSKSRARREKDFPQHNVAQIDIPMWTDDQTLWFINGRINEHLAAEKTLPDCSQEERWADAPKFAVMKKGNKRAVKLYETQEQAEAHAEKDKVLFVQFRGGSVGIRCEDYCEVQKFCNQYKKLTGGLKDAI